MTLVIVVPSTLREFTVCLALSTPGPGRTQARTRDSHNLPPINVQCCPQESYVHDGSKCRAITSALCLIISAFPRDNGRVCLHALQAKKKKGGKRLRRPRTAAPMHAHVTMIIISIGCDSVNLKIEVLAFAGTERRRAR